MNKKHTAVEWFLNKIIESDRNGFSLQISKLNEWADQAKAMDKKQKMDAFLAGQKDIAMLIHQIFPMPQTMKEIELIEKVIEVNENGDQYFTETYEDGTK